MMKNFVSWALGAAVVAISASLVQQAAADLYVTQVGDGSAALSSVATATFVQKFAITGGSPLSTIAMPTTASGGNFALTNSGSATSEGFLSLSSDGQYLLLAGYNASPGTTGIAGTDSATVNRVVGRINVATGAVDTTTALSDTSYNLSNIRSVASNDGVSLWMGGNGNSTAGGVRYTTLGSTTSTQILSTPTNIRVVKIANGQLYFSSASGTFQGVTKVGQDLPTEPGQSTTQLTGIDPPGTNSTYDFWFKDANTLYVAGDANAANGGGIQKWTLNGETWGFQYTLLNSGTATTSVRGLTGTIDNSGNAVLYATTTATSANQLISVIDTDASATATTLATASANTAFRGVAYVPSGISPPANNADFNGDNIVDGADFLIWQRGFGLTGQPNKSTGDANGDGNVNGLDLDQWKSKFGGAPAVVAIGAVPEPASLGLASLAALALLGLRSRAR